MKLRFFVCLFLPFFGVNLNAQTELDNLGTKAYSILNLPNLAGENISGQITVAVIDDGFLLNHKSLEGFIWTNINEIPNNGLDDDSNGYVDDVHGWDVSDFDNDVSVSRENNERNYHGTMIASIITRIATMSLGEEAKKHIKIMPIKALSDFAKSPSMADGYRGIDYAVKNKADIICMAWSGGSVEPEYARKLGEATQANILLLASAGNEYSFTIPPPAGLDKVYCIAAHDSLYQKYYSSNYGQKVDLIATGDRVLAAHSISENAFFSGGGTSAAAALATGTAALLKAIVPQARPREIMEALKNTAIPIDKENPRYLARLGAGRIDASQALYYLRDPNSRSTHFLPYRTKGRYFFQNDNGKIQQGIEQLTGTKQITLVPGNTMSASKKCLLSIWANDTLFKELPLAEFTQDLIVPGTSCRFTLQNCKRIDDYYLDYYATPYDSTSLYCSGETYLSENKGHITDGSGSDPYANNVSCKWIITVEEGQNIKLDFNQFDTQPNVDKVLIYNGTKALQENALAGFSGNDLPPVIIVNTNQVLIWFVTDGSNTQDGWELLYAATRQEAGVYKRPEQN